MKNLILLFLLVVTISYSCNSQDDVAKIETVFSEFNALNYKYRKSVEKHLESLKKNIRVPEVSKNSKKESEYVENHLIPIFPLVREQICRHQNEEVFQGLMEIMVNTSGAADEGFSDILGEIYVCRPDFMLEYISKHEEYNLLIRRVDFGFLNFQYQNPERADLPKLKDKLDSLNSIKPFRNN